MAERAGAPDDNEKEDCGCGCGGDCNEKNEASTPPKQARRALLAGASSAMLIATLANRRAFGQPATGAQCGPISHIGSLNPSQQGQPTGCGGLTGGFWKNHAVCVANVLGGNPSTITLGSKLSNLALVDPVSAATTFTNALCDPSSNASHGAAAILDVLSPSMNPQYGYTLASLNAAILTAHNQGVSGAAILTALKTLENDFGTNTGGCATVPLCSA